MKYLKIQNDGLLDIRLIALMGGTTKANNKFKIGQFGTGLKYTLAYLFRNGLDFKIFPGATEAIVSTVTEHIGSDTFEIICINKERTSITTGMGLEWKAWMILRELWCNALDEGGHSKEIIKDEFEKHLIGYEGKTTFYIQINSDMQEALDNWNKYFIPEDHEPIFENADFRLYSPADHMCLYKNGVLIHENISVKSVFRYDIRYASINELREYRNAPSYDISTAIKQLNPEGIKFFLDRVDSTYYEGNNMDYTWYAKWGETWETFMMSTKLLTENIKERFTDHGYSYNDHDYTMLPQCLYNSLTDQFKNIDGLEVAKNELGFYEVTSIEIDTKVKLCLEKMAEMGYVFNPEIPIRYGFFDDKDLLMKISKDQLLISTKTSQLTIEQTISRLIEKCEEITHRLDSTANIKNHFIHLYIKLLINKYGDPLLQVSPHNEEAQKSLWVCFTLSMPGVGAWDGKWTAANDKHLMIRMVRKDTCERIFGAESIGSWEYDFKDGWRARIEGRITELKEHAALQEGNKGFCNYEWMVDSIITRGEILSSKDILESEKEQAIPEIE